MTTGPLASNYQMIYNRKHKCHQDCRIDCIGRVEKAAARSIAIVGIARQNASLVLVGARG